VKWILKWGRLPVYVLWVVLTAVSAPLRSADADLVTLNFVNADIEGVVRAVSEITGKNFALDPRVKGSINIISSRPMSKALVYEVFLSALRLQGYAAIEERGLVKIVPESEAKMQSVPTRLPQEGTRSGGDQIQTQVFVLKHEPAAQLVAVLRPLIAPNNVITAYQATNTLVITDYAGNLQRIGKIIEAIDKPGGADPVVIPLEHASALEVARTILQMFPEQQAAAAPGAGAMQALDVVVDARSNSLIVRADNPSRLARVRVLVAALDSPTGATGNIHVVHLKNAEAVKVAETLRAIYLGEASGAAAPSGDPLRSISANAPAGTLPTVRSPVSATGTVQRPGMIQADAATNSIIINAPSAIYNNLRAVVEKLDVRRAQVYVEALIAEITADKAAEFGIQWQDLSSLGGAGNNMRSFGGTNFGNANQNFFGIAQNPAAAGRGLNVGVVRGNISIPGIGQVLDLRLLIRALEADANVNILSTPTLLTLDNEEAKIVIGQNVPFITGQYALSGAATTPTPFQTVERRDVGLTLRIKPQISEGGVVRLQFYQEVSSVQDTTNLAGVITNKRSIESTVLVDDGQIIVIGGLIQDSLKDGVEKVPVLGDIPLLGALFRYNTRSRSKTNLMVFLRPTVLRDAQHGGPLTNDRYDYILGEQRRIQPEEGGVVPEMESPSLPPRLLPAQPVQPGLQ